MERIDVKALYDERGKVTSMRPIMQGDVFSDIILPGFGGEPQIVQVVAHPCAMRRGPSLTERVTVAPVLRSVKVEGEAWDGNLRSMPLDDLLGDGETYATRFQDVTAAPSGLLTLDRRIASLSNRGIYVLRQRLVKHYTRLTVDIPTLRKQAAPVLEEAEQERDWIETILDGDEPTPELISEAAREFDEWLGRGDPSRRDLLGDESNHRDVRRATHSEALDRRAKRGEARFKDIVGGT
jgi:hypothetical protein